MKRYPASFIKKLREEANHWLVGLTVQDVVAMSLEEEKLKEDKRRGAQAYYGPAQDPGEA